MPVRKTPKTIECFRCYKPFETVANRRKYCDLCIPLRKNEKVRSRRASTNERHKEKLRDKYKLTLERYEEMLQAQGYKCAIDTCTVMHEEPLGRLSVDHDHSCCPGPYSCGNCIRGLLCMRHNAGLGNFEDDIESLKAAIAYLEGVEARREKRQR